MSTHTQYFYDSHVISDADICYANIEFDVINADGSPLSAYNNL